MTRSRKTARQTTRSRKATRPAPVVGLLLVAVLALVLFRPSNDEGPGDGGAASSPSSAPAGSPSDEAFCAEFRRLSAMQSEYAAVPDARAEELLEEAADRLVAIGVPRSMSLEARGGYYTRIYGIYESLGLSLDPSAVPGAANGQQLPGAGAAFTAYLREYCPA